MKPKFSAGDIVFNGAFIMEIISHEEIGYTYRVIGLPQDSDFFVIGKTYRPADTEHVNEMFKKLTKLDKVLK